MTVLEVLTVPDPRLKYKAKKVAEVNDEIRTIMDDMLETMYADEGIGLAAIQVGIEKAIITIDLQSDDDGKNKGLYPLYLANPEIIEVSEEMVDGKEGCLSLPEQAVIVSRHQSIKIKYLDYHNKEKTLEASGWLARCIQHEMDHLQGITLIEYLSPIKKDIAIRKLKKIKRHIQKK